MKRKRVLIMIDWIWPAYKAGGPVKSIRNLVDQLGSQFEFLILAGDRDLGEERPFQNIMTDQWINDGECRIMYLSKGEQGLFNLYDIINDIRPDVLYVNGIFSRFFSFYPILLSAVYGLPVGRLVVAPRGMFGPGALRKRKWKKKLYLMLYRRLLRRAGKVIWHAMDKKEEQETREVLKNYVTDVRIATNIPDRPLEEVTSISKEGPLKLVSISRLAREKNIDGMIDWLQGFDGRLQLDVYGWFEDESFERRVMDLANSLGENVDVHFLGEVSPVDVKRAIKDYHFFISLTHGENFGHAIYESLACGRPVIISPHTPWSNIEEIDGGVVIDSKEELHEALHRFCGMDGEEWESMCGAALTYAKKNYKITQGEADHMKLFSE